MRIRNRLFPSLSCLLVLIESLWGQADLNRLSVDDVKSFLTRATGDSTSLLKATPERPEPFPIRLPVSPVLFSFSRMVRSAGAIFAGTVTAIQHPPSANESVATVTITFHVDHGMRGVLTGRDFAIRQWAGLWNSGQQRYRVGEKVLLFLYPPSKLGLTSCVGAASGRFPVDVFGRVVLTPEHRLAFRADPFLGGRSTIDLWDFEQAVRYASAGEEAVR